MRYIFEPILFILLFSCFLSSCSGECHVGEHGIDAAADSFATNYFNYRFVRSLQFCTPESEKWVRFAASNIIQEDIDTLRAQASGATYEIEDVDEKNDTLAVVKYRVSDFLLVDTLGRAGRIVGDCVFDVPFVYRHGKWMVKMEAPLRSERQSRD